MLTKLVNIGITGTWEEKYKNLINYSGSEQLMISAGDVDIGKIYKNLIYYSGSEQLMISAGDIDIGKIYKLD